MEFFSTQEVLSKGENKHTSKKNIKKIGYVQKLEKFFLLIPQRLNIFF